MLVLLLPPCCSSYRVGVKDTRNKGFEGSGTVLASTSLDPSSSALPTPSKSRIVCGSRSTRRGVVFIFQRTFTAHATTFMGTLRELRGVCSLPRVCLCSVACSFAVESTPAFVTGAVAVEMDG
jgi:hypothetical protein